MHPFQGGETQAKIRLNHFSSSGSMTTYHSTYKNLLGINFSSKLSAYLALGCITLRQIHASLIAFENTISTPEIEDWKGGPGLENEGTTRMRVAPKFGRSLKGSGRRGA